MALTNMNVSGYLPTPKDGGTKPNVLSSLLKDRMNRQERGN